MNTLIALVVRILSMPFKFIKKLFDSSAMERDYLRLQQEVIRLCGVENDGEKWIDAVRLEIDNLIGAIAALNEENNFHKKCAEEDAEHHFAALEALKLKAIILANDNIILKQEIKDLLAKQPAAKKEPALRKKVKKFLKK